MTTEIINEDVRHHYLKKELGEGRGMVSACSPFSQGPSSGQELPLLRNLTVGQGPLWPAKGVCLWGEPHYRTGAEWGGNDSIIKGPVFLRELSLITIIPLQ